MKILAIIPARGGSKGVPGKNKKHIDGIPLVQYTIDVVKQILECKDIYVSSDDSDILNIAKENDLRIHIRPNNLSCDLSPISDTITEVIKLAEQDNLVSYDYIMLLQPTAPIREVFHIQEAITLLSEDNLAASLVSVSESVDIHPARMYKLDGVRMTSFMPELENERRQDLPKAYCRNGSIYIAKKSAFIEQETIMAKPSIAYIMDGMYWANIDEPKDVLITEVLIKEWKKL